MNDFEGMLARDTRDLQGVATAPRTRWVAKCIPFQGTCCATPLTAARQHAGEEAVPPQCRDRRSAKHADVCHTQLLRCARLEKELDKRRSRVQRVECASRSGVHCRGAGGVGAHRYLSGFHLSDCFLASCSETNARFPARLTIERTILPGCVIL